MIYEYTWEPWQLTYGVCMECGEYSAEIVIGDGRCIDCIDAERFYNDSMNNQSIYEEVNFKNF